MKFITCLLTFLACLTCNIAHAGIFYKWHATNDVAPTGFHLLLEFDPAVVRAGSFTMSFDHEEPHGGYPTSGLRSLVMGFDDSHVGINWTPRQPSGDPGPHILSMNVRFTPDGYLTGGIRASNFDSSFGMSSGMTDEYGFYLSQVSSDYFFGGCDHGNMATCVGATGQIRQVPEPQTIGLLALGLVGLAVARRKAVVKPG